MNCKLCCYYSISFILILTALICLFVPPSMFFKTMANKMYAESDLQILYKHKWITCNEQSLHCVHLWEVVVAFSHSVMSNSLQPPWTAAHQDSLSITNPQSLLKLMSIESVMPSNYLIHVIPFSSHLQSFPALGSFPSAKDY